MYTLDYFGTLKEYVLPFSPNMPVAARRAYMRFAMNEGVHAVIIGNHPEYGYFVAILAGPEKNPTAHVMYQEIDN
jgi:hypothetical protein